MKLTITFKPDDLHLLVPAGATAEETWVVCAGHRPTVKTNSVEALGSIDSWQPMIPMPSRGSAEQWCERFARSTTSGIDHLNWWPLDDPGSGFELFAVLDDGTEHTCDFAVVPLRMLAEGGAR